VGGAGALGATDERLGKRRGQLRRDRLAGVLDDEHGDPGAGAGHGPHGPVVDIVDDGVVQEVRRQLPQQRVGAQGQGDVAGGLDADTAFLGEREQRFRGLLHEQGEVDGRSGEGALIRPAEHEQRLGEVDRARVDGVETVEELTRVLRRLVAGHLEECLGDRQRRA
jgi:hypothetical protein